MRTVLRQMRYAISWVVTSCALFSCSYKSNTDQASGNVLVQVPVQTSSSAYQLKTLQLLGIEQLREVSGAFVKFFYSPGSNGFNLTGQSPVAHFIKSGSVFIPSDFISTQMATIYFHMQSLAALDQQVGAGAVITWPRSVGLETQVEEAYGIRVNGAFYDGKTDAMMFVPFTNSELPISVNAGIIAHEHFHSLFYKLILKSAIEQKLVLSKSASIHDEKKIEFIKTKMQVQDIPNDAVLFNELYLRGINEGFADFWGWVYTEDTEFMKWSLPSYASERSLKLNAATTGQYVTKNKILDMLDNAKFSDDIQGSLASYSYEIGTPHARFLKQLASIYSSDNQVSMTEAKIKVAQDLIVFLNSFKSNLSQLNQDQQINEKSVFQYFADQKIKSNTLTKASCEFLVQYLNFDTSSSDLSQKLKCSNSNNKILMVSDTDKAKPVQP